MPTLDLIASILEFIGTVMIAFTALRVHHRVLMEHRIDDKVFGMMKREQLIGFVGVAILSTGFILSLISHYLLRL
jgi:hypothetical protein